MAKKKAKSSSKSVSKKPVKKAKAAPKKAASKAKPSAKPKTVAKPAQTTAPFAATQADSLAALKQETTSTAAVQDFSKKLDETAKLVQQDKSPDFAKPADLPSFTPEHEKRAEEKQKATEKDVPVSPPSETQSMLDQLKKPQEAEKPQVVQELPHHEKKTISAIVLSLIGILVPICSIIGFVMAIKAKKMGSHTAKGTILLAIFTFIINLIIIFMFLKYFVAPV